jgi:enediyne polyketide synthase
VAAGRVFGAPTEVTYRPDGRPEVAGEGTVSAAHGGGLTVLVAARGTVACDLEPVARRTADAWQALLGAHADLVQPTVDATGDDPDVAATRVWTAIECLQKAGLPAGSPLALRSSERAGWALFRAGSTSVATFVTGVRGIDEPVVFAVLTQERG